MDTHMRNILCATYLSPYGLSNQLSPRNCECGSTVLSKGGGKVQPWLLQNLELLYLRHVRIERFGYVYMLALGFKSQGDTLRLIVFLIIEFQYTHRSSNWDYGFIYFDMAIADDEIWQTPKKATMSSGQMILPKKMYSRQMILPKKMRAQKKAEGLPKTMYPRKMVLPKKMFPLRQKRKRKIRQKMQILFLFSSN